jgi:hypothetical protein
LASPTTEKIVAKLARAQTSVLEIAYEQNGPTGSIPVVPLHGYPYDASVLPASIVRECNPEPGPI